MASSDSHHHDARAVFFGPVINPVSLTQYSILPQCLLFINPSGTIHCMIDHVEINKLEETLSSNGYGGVKVVQLKDGEFLMPGFIDTHTHAPQFPIMGTGSQYELLEWLQKLVFPTEGKFNDENLHFAQEAYKSIVRRLLDFGTTTCCYFGSLHLKATMVLADIVHEYGQRAFIGKCNMNRESGASEDYIESSTDVSLETTHTLISHIRGLEHHAHCPDQEPLVQPILTPRFALSCTQDLLLSLGSLAYANPNLRIQTHISENKSEVVETLKVFPGAKSYAGVYDMYGLLRHNTILAHAVHLTKEEVELIKERGAGISHCPTSNFNLNSGIAPVGYYLDRGVKVGLGTDVSGGYSLSILNAIQNASIASKVLSFKQDYPKLEAVGDTASDGTSSETTSESHNDDHHDHHNHHHHHHHDHHHHDQHNQQFTNRPLPISALLYLATAGGAAVCGLEKQVGSFDVGKSFDALLVNAGGSSQNPGLWGMAIPSHLTDGKIGLKKKKEKVDGWLERFLHCGDDRNIERVYVQGRFVGGRMFST